MVLVVWVLLLIFLLWLSLCFSAAALLLMLLLFVLLWQGHEGCVRTLLLTGADRDARRGLDAATPLHQVKQLLFLPFEVCVFSMVL